MKSIRAKSEENAATESEAGGVDPVQRKFDEAVETIESIRSRLDDLEFELKGRDDLLHRLAHKLIKGIDEQARARPLVLFVSTLAAGIVAARLLRR